MVCTRGWLHCSSGCSTSRWRRRKRFCGAGRPGTLRRVALNHRNARPALAADRQGLNVVPQNVFRCLRISAQVVRLAPGTTAPVVTLDPVNPNIARKMTRPSVNGSIEKLPSTSREQMPANRHIESIMDLQRPNELIAPYTRYMSYAIAWLARPPSRIAIVGMGGGRTIGYLLSTVPEAVADAVELDPEVVRLAAKYFGTESSERLRIHPGDGRVFLS